MTDTPERSAEREREAVVAWLRLEADAYERLGASFDDDPKYKAVVMRYEARREAMAGAADAIERRDHYAHTAEHLNQEKGNA